MTEPTLIDGTMVCLPRSSWNELMAKMDYDYLTETVGDILKREVSNEWVETEEAAEILHFKAKKLESFRNRGELSYFQWGEKILYRRSDLLAFLERNRKVEVAKNVEIPVEDDLFDLIDIEYGNE